jgi:hypothetical protein
MTPPYVVISETATMNRKLFGLFVSLLLFAISVCAQSRIDEHGVKRPTEEELAASKRLHDLLQKPDFITLRLTHGYVSGQPVETPQPYAVGDSMYFQLFISQSLFDSITVENSRWAPYAYRPELNKNGDVLPLSKEAQKGVERADGEPPSGSYSPVSLAPGREYEWATVRIEDWYDRLGPGHYELSVRKRFVWDGDWVQSNSVTFDVVPRKIPEPIPAGVSVELVPDAFQDQPTQKLYRLSGEVYVTVVVVNSTNREIVIPVIDRYYVNRPQLFKDGILLPYLDGTLKLLNSKEENPSLVELGRITLFPHTSMGLPGLGLTEWYGQLSPGQYKLINRRRFEIDGPWTADSAELLFEIVPQGLKN